MSVVVGRQARRLATVLLPAGSRGMPAGSRGMPAWQGAPAPPSASIPAPPPGPPILSSRSFHAPCGGAQQAAQQQGQQPVVSPAARLILAAAHVDASTLTGTGPHGIVTKGDALAALSSATPPTTTLPNPSATAAAAAAVTPAAALSVPPAAAPPAVAAAPVSPKPAAPAVAPAAVAAAPTVASRAPAPAAGSAGAAGGSVAPGAFGSYVDTPTSQIRRIIAQRLMESKWGSPHLFAEADAEIDALLSLRKELKDRWQVSVSVNDFVIKAAAMALAEIHDANVHWDAKKAAIIPNTSVDISIAVATDKGLITPIVKDADKKSLGAIAKEVKQLAERARAGKLLPHEFQGGTFSISNLGMYSIDRFSAILNPPQSGILAVGRGDKALRLPAHPVTDGPSLHPVTRMDLTLSADARALDASLAGRLLSTISANLTNPHRLLI